MPMIRMPLISLNLLSLAMAVLMGIFSSCDRFDGEQEIPAYIRVDSIGFSSNYDKEGTDKQAIIDVWVYVNDQLIGGFEVPAEIPVLQQGISKIEIRPGVKLNGISSTRAPYPYLDPVIIPELNLVPDSAVNIYPETEYRSNTVFVWMEDFEDPALSIVSGNGSDTGMFITTPANAPGAFLDEYSEFSGEVVLEDDNTYMLLQSDDGNGEGFVLTKGYYIFLELHFKTDIPVVVGLFIKQQDNSILKTPYIILNTTDEWKKIYVNFTPKVSDAAGAQNFKVYFEASRSDMDPSNAHIMFDNIKLLSRQNL